MTVAKYPAIPHQPNEPRNIAAMRQILEILTGQRGSGELAAITSGTIDSSLFNQTVNQYYSTGGTGGTGGTVEAPNEPTGVTGSPLVDVIILGFNRADYEGHAYTNVYRSDDAIFSNATLQGNTDGTLYADDVVAGQTYYYWLKHVNENAAEGSSHIGSPLVVTSGIPVSYLLDALSSSITASELHQDLLTPIGNISTNTSSIIQEGVNRANAIASEAASRSAEISTGIAVESGVRSTNDSTIAASVSTLASVTSTATATNTAQISTLSEAITNGNGSYAAISTGLEAVTTEASTNTSTVAVNVASILSTAAVATTASSAAASVALDLVATNSNVTTNVATIGSVSTVTANTSTATATVSTNLIATTQTAANASTLASTNTAGIASVSTVAANASSSVAAVSTNLIATTATAGNASTLASTNTAEIASVSTVASNASSATATLSTTLGVTVGNNTVALQSTAVVTGETTDDVTHLNTQMTFKVDAGGRVSGYGFANTTTIYDDQIASHSEMIFNVDTFAIGSPDAAVGDRLAFVVNPAVGDNRIYLDRTFITDFTADTGRIYGGLAVGSITGLDAAFINAELGTLWATNVFVSNGIQSDDYATNHQGWKLYETGDFIIRGANGEIIMEVTSGGVTSYIPDIQNPANKYGLTVKVGYGDISSPAPAFCYFSGTDQFGDPVDENGEMTTSLGTKITMIDGNMKTSLVNHDGSYIVYESDGTLPFNNKRYALMTWFDGKFYYDDSLGNGIFSLVEFFPTATRFVIGKVSTDGSGNVTKAELFTHGRPVDEDYRITPANAGVYIKELSLGTGQVADNAITVPVFMKQPAQILHNTTVAGYTPIIDVAMNSGLASDGNPNPIMVTINIVTQGWPLSAYGHFRLRNIEDGEDLWVIVKYLDSGDVDNTYLSANFEYTPPTSGTKTYALEVEANDAGSDTFVVTAESTLFLLAVKK